MENAPTIIDFIRVAGLLPALLVLVGTWMSAALVGRFMARLGQRFTDKRLLLEQAATLLRFFFYLGGIAAALLLSFNLSDQAMLALGGTIAVTLGFAFKDLAASVLAGLTILVDKPFQVGNRVAFGSYYGEITAIGLRSVRLTTLEDSVVTIPNNAFLTEAVLCANAGALDMLVQLDFYVGLEEDVGLARRIVGEAITSSRYAWLERPWKVLVHEVLEQGYLAVRLRAKVHVLDVRYEEELQTDVTERVLEGFREAGVRPPTAYMRVPGAAAAA